MCAKGYYGDPGAPGGCRPCACPSVERNFADACHLLRDGTQSCACGRGYRGERCEKCDYGYFGNPLQGVPCQACLCNANGSVSDECDELTGQCNCKPGITGRDCSYCAPRHVISPSGCTCKSIIMNECAVSLLMIEFLLQLAKWDVPVTFSEPSITWPIRSPATISLTLFHCLGLDCSTTKMLPQQWSTF